MSGSYVPPTQIDYLAMWVWVGVYVGVYGYGVLPDMITCGSEAHYPNLKPYNHSGSSLAPTIIWWSCRDESAEEHDTLHKDHSTFRFHKRDINFLVMDDKINDRERMTTGQNRAKVSKAPSQMENSNTTSTPTSGRGILAVNRPSGLVTVDDSEPNVFSKPLPSQNKGDQKGNYILVGTSVEANLGRDQHIKDKDDTERVSAVSKPSGMDMVGIPDVPPFCDARPLEVKDDAHPGLLARVRGSPDPREMRASRSSRAGGADRHDSDGMLAVTKPSDVGMAGTPDEAPSRDAQLLEMKDFRASWLSGESTRIP
eukprot:3326621-Pleurochrysis_carterae.AAC.2